MQFEETELWEIIIPSEDKGSLTTWYHVIKSQISGITFIKNAYGYWKDQQEENHIVQIACSEEVFKKVLEKTCEHYIQECVMGYKVSNKCIMGYKE
jgi:hypothetical protein